MSRDVLTLEAIEFKDSQHWRWVLRDGFGNYIQDHEIQLDPKDTKYWALIDLESYLDYHSAPDKWVEDQTKLIEDIGTWISENILGPIADKLGSYVRPITVQVKVPPEASALLQMPLDIAIIKGKTLAKRNVSLVFELVGRTFSGEPQGIEDKLRMLAIFSLPTDVSLLALRRERYELLKKINTIAGTHGLAIDLRVLQYGVTRDILADVLAEGEGWDLIHFSGHGKRATLILEKPGGSHDQVSSLDFTELLANASGRLKLVTLSACLSAAATIEETLDWLKLRKPNDARKAEYSKGELDEDKGLMPALGWSIASQLDCAVLAMRYPVGDEFAVNLGRELYDLLLGKGQPLTRALQMAMTKALEDGYNAATPPLSLATPMIIGTRAINLHLKPPKAPVDFIIPTISLAGFPDEPERFVGRMAIMNRASQAFATESPLRGVIFHGMAGAGKTACALEIAFHYYRSSRFQGFVWYKAPERGRDISTALRDLVLAMEAKLNGFKMAHILDRPEEFQTFLPKLSDFLRQKSVLIVLDNLETLLTSNGIWRDEKWGRLIQALLAHSGLSRVVITSRRLPNELDTERLLVEPINTLSLREAALLAREMSHLNKLLIGKSAISLEEGRVLIGRTLEIVQGHPKLMELADAQAKKPEDLKKYLDGAADAWGKDQSKLRAFFLQGESAQEADGFLRVLTSWTQDTIANLSLASRTLFQILCSMEANDRESPILESIWPAVWEHFEINGGAPDLLDILKEIEALGLIEVKPIEEELFNYTIHPGVAEACLAGIDNNFRETVDSMMANLWLQVFSRNFQQETNGSGREIVESGLRAAPYLIRGKEFDKASHVLGSVITRDSSDETVGTALQMLRNMAEATKGTDNELMNSLILARAMRYNNQGPEAETMIRLLINKVLEKRDFGGALTAASDLFYILLYAGKYEESLRLVEDMKGYRHQGNFGPWTELLNEGRRLQVLRFLGHHSEVLELVEDLMRQMNTLADKTDQDETATPWNVRELILGEYFGLALYFELYDAALEINKDIVRSKMDRGATAIDIAESEFNDYGPLLGLKRYEQARDTLWKCKEIFHREKALKMLGSVISGLANLEFKLKHYDQAIIFEENALRYRYIVGIPEEIAISHNNLAIYFCNAGSNDFLSHYIAAAIILLQTRSDKLKIVLENLSHLMNSLPKELPKEFSFDDLCIAVEKIDGVFFRELFKQLPSEVPSGDEALKRLLERTERTK